MRCANTMKAMRRSVPRAQRRWPEPARCADEPALLVEAQGGGRHAAAAGDLLNGEDVVHAASLAQPGLDFKFT